MALFPQCVIGKFLNTSSETEVEEEARKLLPAFFESCNAENIECFGEIYSANDAVRNLSARLASQKAPTSVAEMINHVSENRGAVVFQKGNASMGVTFNVCNGRNAKSRWMLCSSCGPIPMLELRVNHGRDFNPQRQWGEEFFNRGVADLVWLDGKFGVGRPTCFANHDNQYIFWKRQELMSKVSFDRNPSQQAIQAGVALRQICHKVNESEKNDSGDAAILVSWPWKRRRLIKAFDRALIDETGADKLRTILNAMGITVDQWIAM